ncbi:unnamed protein product [Brassicogethes aeneus]|uniref:Uncharacterized protein n=1 Tax=Brassicogethes aeneus TaxID=1431903 RepID=A0A9P0FNE7_BRAAE|nr:unnamed protein product [Brassicogethes aeneus]
MFLKNKSCIYAPLPEDFDFASTDKPRNTKNYILSDLTPDQKENLHRFKVQTIKENNIYLKQNPEVHAFISILLQLIFTKRPSRNVLQFMAKYFNKSKFDIKDDIIQYYARRGLKYPFEKRQMDFFEYSDFSQSISFIDESSQFAFNNNYYKDEEEASEESTLMIITEILDELVENAMNLKDKCVYDALPENFDFLSTDIPRGTKNYNLSFLTPEQQESINRFKVQTIKENNIYLNKTPEVKAIISLLLQRVFLKRPSTDVLIYMAQFFNRSKYDVIDDITEYYAKKGIIYPILKENYFYQQSSSEDSNVSIPFRSNNFFIENYEDSQEEESESESSFVIIRKLVYDLVEDAVTTAERNDH